MSLLKLTNTLNLIANQSQQNNELQGYHLGNSLNEINYNAENNYNPHNQDGSKFPFLLALMPDGSWDVAKAAFKNYVVQLYFYDLQWRDNDAIPSTRNETDIVKMNNLEKVASNFIQNLYTVGNLGTLGFRFGFSEVVFETATNLENDRLLGYSARFTITPFQYQCPTWAFDVADIPADYDLTDIGSVDFETIIPV